MAVLVVFREHKVHRVAGGFVIESPLKPGAEERKLEDEIVHDRLWNLFIFRGIRSVIGKIVILYPVLVGLDAVVDEVVSHLAASYNFV